MNYPEKEEEEKKILTQSAYIGNGEKSCFILQQIHWAEMRDVI